MYPLANFKSVKRTLKFKQPYPAGFGSVSGKPHMGTDYIIPVGTPIYAHTDGTVKYVYGKEGGHTAHFIDSKGSLVRWLHLSDGYGTARKLKEGDLIGLSGGDPKNPESGLSTAPHTHGDVSINGKLELSNYNNLVDPDIYFEQFNNKPMLPDTVKLANELGIVNNVENALQVIQNAQKEPMGFLYWILEVNRKAKNEPRFK